MGKHTPLEMFDAPPAQQPVIVNTSGSNTAYLPTPQNIDSALISPNGTIRQIAGGPPFAIQQTKSFGPVLIDKSVLPSGRIYHYNARGGLNGSKDGKNQDIIDADATALNDDYAHERAGSSIIANY